MPDHPSPPPTWLTPDEAAAYLRCGRSTLLRLSKAGEITAHRMSHKMVRYDRAELDAWIRSRAGR